MKLEERINKLLTVALSPSAAQAERNFAWSKIQEHAAGYGPHELAVLVKGEDDDFSHFFGALRRAEDAMNEHAALTERHLLVQMQIAYYEKHLAPEVRQAWRKRVKDLGSVVEEVDPEILKAPKKKRRRPESVSPRIAALDRAMKVLELVRDHDGILARDLQEHLGGGRTTWRMAFYHLRDKMSDLIVVSDYPHAISITDAGREFLEKYKASLSQAPDS